MNTYEPQPYYTRVPQTMEQVAQEFFNPVQKKPHFKGYEPNFYFKQVSSPRSDTKSWWET